MTFTTRVGTLPVFTSQSDLKEIKLLKDKIEQLEIERDMANAARERVSAMIYALNTGELKEMDGTWEGGFKSCLNKITKALYNSPDWYLNHRLEIADNRIDYLENKLRKMEKKL